MLWIYLHFPNLQLDALLAQAQKAADKQKPLVILDARSHHIVQLNQSAAALGITLNMGLGTAAALASDLQVLPYEPRIAENKLNELAEALYLVTCDISFFTPQGLLLRSHNMLRLYGDLATYWQTLKNQLSPLKVSYQYASGHSPLAAKMLALKGWNTISADLTILKQQVSQCVLQQSDIEHRTQQKLNRVGLRTIGDLLKVPFADLAKRFDLELVNYVGRLSGEFKHPVDFFHPAEVFERYMELLYDIENTSVLQRPLKLLLVALEQFLKVRDRLTQSLNIRLYQRDHPPLDWSIGSQQGEYSAERWAALIALKAQTLTLESAVYGIGLTTGQTEVRSPDKEDLFSGKKGTVSRLQLVSLLQAKLGDDAVMSPHWCNDTRPEKASLYQTPTLSTISASSVSPLLQAVRPSFLLATPQVLREKVSILYGPERIHSGWWDNHNVIRDYYVARNAQGQWYWVFKQPDASWYLHGLFS